MKREPMMRCRSPSRARGTAGASHGEVGAGDALAKSVAGFSFWPVVMLAVTRLLNCVSVLLYGLGRVAHGSWGTDLGATGCLCVLYIKSFVRT